MTLEAAGWVDRIVADATIRVLAGEVKRLRRLLSDALRIHYEASARRASLEIENAVLRDFIACQPIAIMLDKRTAERDEALAEVERLRDELVRVLIEWNDSREELAKATDAAQAQEALIAQIMRDGL